MNVRGEHSRYLFPLFVLGYMATVLSLTYLGPVGRHLHLFSLSYAVAFLFLWGLLKTLPPDWPDRNQLFFILGLAALTRLILLPFPPSDDVNRYVWEGYVLNKGFNPYVHAPDDPVLEPFINDVWYGINHKDLTAVYPPLSLLLFRLAALVSPTLGFFKILIVSFDVAAIGLLAALLRRYGLPASRLALYALNPLVIVFIAGEAHVDAIHVFFFSLSFLFFARNKDGGGFFFLGCAVMIKYFAIVFTPFLIHGRNWKKSRYMLGVMGLLLLLFWGSWNHFFSSLVPFGTTMHYNDSIAPLFRSVFGSHAAWASGFILAACLLIVYLIVQKPLRSAFLAAGCLLLLLGTLHPWYLVLVTPFLVLFPSRAWLYLHFAMVFTFPTISMWYHTGVFQEVVWLKFLEYAPFYVLLIWDGLRVRQGPLAPVFRSVQGISVVIPTLNERNHIGRCLAALHEEKAVIEAIVVDGGSTDGTTEIARREKARIFHAKRGRGNQIGYGISRSRGDVILILHADCVIQSGVPAMLLQKLNRDFRCIGGAMGMEFFESTFKDRIISCLNNLRARWTGISFGDQAQYLRKEAISLIGGFPGLMMMEDLELSMRLRENGKVCFMPHGVRVSKRRWENVGFWSNGLWIASRCLRYLVQRRLGVGDATGRDFYEHYYPLHRA